MATKKISVKALVNIRHNGEHFEIGNVLKLNEDEVASLSERGFVEILESQVAPGTDKKDSKNDEDKKGGE